MKKFSCKGRKKYICFFATFIGCTLSFSFGFSTYKIESNNVINNYILMENEHINIIQENIYYLGFNGIVKSIEKFKNDIVSDDASINFTFFQQKYLSDSFFKNSGLLISINVENLNLYSHIKKIEKNFINISYDDLFLKLDKNINYCAGGKHVLEYDDANQIINFRLPIMLEDTNDTEFYLLNFLNYDNAHLSINTNSWDFNVNLDFHFVNIDYTYSTIFNSENLGNIFVKMEIERYEV